MLCASKFSVVGRPGGLRGVLCLRRKSDSLKTEPDCEIPRKTSCDYRVKDGYFGGECPPPHPRSRMDHLWHHHRPYFPLLKDCFRTTIHPRTYQPGYDPNANNLL